MRYKPYRETGRLHYLYPPRPPKDPTPPETLPSYEERGYWLDYKMQGTCNLLLLDAERKIIAKSRHPNISNGDHKAWSPDENTRKPFLRLPGNGWYAFTAELLNNKVSNLRNINFIFDILVADGEYLIGTTFEERRQLLAKLFPNAISSICQGYKVIDAHTWLATSLKSDFLKIFKGLATEPLSEQYPTLLEGVVLKHPQGRLKLCTSEYSNSSWQLKSRRSTGRAPF